MVGEVCEELHCSDRLRKKESPLPLPPPEYDLDLEQIESQCVAQCEGGKIDTFSMTRGDDLSGDSTYAQSLACHDGFLVTILSGFQEQHFNHAHADSNLVTWVKGKQPILPLPPKGLGKLTGFRDPFVFAQKSDSSPWKMIIGSGIEGQGGTILVYHSQDLSKGTEPWTTFCWHIPCLTALINPLANRKSSSLVSD